MYLSAYDLLSGAFQERAKQAIEIIRNLEKIELLLDAQPDAQANRPEDKAELNKLVQTLKQVHYKQGDFKS